VGKTTLACRIIRHLSQTERVIGIKVSAHFHPFNESDVLFRGHSFIILNERQISRKDSSRMLQAGAEKVYFVMAEKESLQQALEKLLKLLPDSLLVCESGGLDKIAQPGLFLFVNFKNKKIVKSYLLHNDPIIVMNDGTDFDLNIHQIGFENRQFKLNK